MKRNKIKLPQHKDNLKYINNPFVLILLKEVCIKSMK